jgi:hypothetical protein
LAARTKKQAAGEHPEMGAPFGGAQEQRLGARRGVLQPILRVMRSGGTFVGNECRDVGGVLDLRPAIETTRMTREHVLAIVRASSSSAASSTPSSVIEPASGRSRPAMRLSSVDLPMPDSPITAT